MFGSLGTTWLKEHKIKNLNLKTKTTKVVVSVKTSEAVQVQSTKQVSVKTSEAVQVQSTKQVSVKTSEAVQVQSTKQVSVKTSECGHKRVTFPNFR
ncbi:hypothetical protein [Campylobacter hyointestinalis]|uniref:hypothetical protein n=1 Tax=Campylobacter hyointestinalis TaxID=198 RepID=UPI0011AC570F|nr:hypothetical protein [Campylobacter hyointestinalis]TWO28806.1 hypothetical protein YZ79_09240 [Campylobacter hyointestinalis]